MGPVRAGELRSPEAPVLGETQTRNPSLRLTPRHAQVEDFVAQAMSDLGPGVLSEALFLYRKPHGRDEPWTPEEMTMLFNRTVALSTLAGIEYFSASRGAMRVLYETSSVIDAPGTRRALADPVFASPPASLSLYARQRDLTFGDNTYRFDYITGPDLILFSQENITAMSVGIIPAIGRNRFRMTLAVIDAGDSLLVYAAAMARVATLLGMGERVSDSFNNRLHAALGWFSGHADQVFGSI
ncbi:MAG: hypothetical protein FWE09_06625 [Treponema sp.]|nr:hypothetical protein [Treponema sp.]